MNSETATAFLQALLSGGQQPMAADRLAVVVAHPNDETIGTAGLLLRTTGAHVVLARSYSRTVPADAAAGVHGAPQPGSADV